MTEDISSEPKVEENATNDEEERKAREDVEPPLGMLRVAARRASKLVYGRKFDGIERAYRLYVDPIQRWADEKSYQRFLKKKPIVSLAQYEKRRKLGEIEEFVPCPVCGKTKFQPLYHPINESVKNSYDYYVVRCPKCELLFRNPSVKPEHLHLLYDVGNYSAFLEGKYGKKRERKYELSMAAFAPYFDKGEGRRLLDYGCGTGIFLRLAHRRGFRTFGIDLSPDSIEVARQRRGGKHTFCGRIEDVPEINQKKFDVITLWSVLAHLPRPVDTLKQLRGLLKPDGFLTILTVNNQSLTLKHYRDNWNGFTRNHLAFFSRKAIRSLAHESGYESVQFRPWYGDSLEAGTAKLPLDIVEKLKAIEDKTHQGRMIRAVLFAGEKPKPEKPPKKRMKIKFRKLPKKKDAAPPDTPPA